MGDPTPETCRDKLGCRLEMVVCKPDDLERLIDMYDTLFPEPVAQGLPPAANAARREWLTDLLQVGVNFLVFQEGKAVGHAALLVEGDFRSGEYLIFVGRPFRKRGIATQLTRRAMSMATDLGLKSIWLTVESDNFRAVRLYKKFGFKFCSKGYGERKMTIAL